MTKKKSTNGIESLKFGLKTALEEFGLTPRESGFLLGCLGKLLAFMDNEEVPCLLKSGDELDHLQSQLVLSAALGTVVRRILTVSLQQPPKLPEWTKPPQERLILILIEGGIDLSGSLACKLDRVRDDFQQYISDELKAAAEKVLHFMMPHVEMRLVNTFGYELGRQGGLIWSGYSLVLFDLLVHARLGHWRIVNRLVGLIDQCMISCFPLGESGQESGTYVFLVA
ncbi:MAG: hypothetical protein ABIJ46_00255 [bacterium]